MHSSPLTLLLLLVLPIDSCINITSTWNGGHNALTLCVDSKTGQTTNLYYEIGGTFQLSVLFPGQVYLPDCTLKSCAVSPPNPVLTVTRTFSCQATFWHDAGLEVHVRDRYSGVAGAIQWRTEVDSPSKAFWTSPISSVMDFRHLDTPTYWTAGVRSSSSWNVSHNPLEFQKFQEASYPYGGPRTNPLDPPGGFAPTTAFPMVTVKTPNNGNWLAVSQIQAPDDIPIYATLSMTDFGRTNFSRFYNKLGAGSSTVRFTQYIVLTEPDWRPAVQWMVNRWPRWFYPSVKVPVANMMGGGAYADYEGQAYNWSKYTSMDYMLNWDASFAYPFHGMYLPHPPFLPNGSSEWRTCFPHADSNNPHYKHPCHNASYATINSWYRKMRSAGFHTCAYFNFFEYGWKTVDINKPLNCPPPAELNDTNRAFCNSNNFMRKYFPTAPIRNYLDNAIIKGGDGGAIVMDPENEGYSAHILSMAEALATITPSQGLCIDRQDWIGRVNPAADDGLTWFVPPEKPRHGIPVRAMINSWHYIAQKVSTLMHSFNQGVLINDHSHRLDMFRHADGVYDEFGDDTAKLFTSSLLCMMGKPAIMWNHKTTESKAVELLLQETLLVGNHPTVPFPQNDHCIQPNTAKLVDIFTSYGPLFRRLAPNREWNLLPNPVILSPSNAALTNSFINGKYLIIVVVLGPLNAAFELVEGKVPKTAGGILSGNLVSVGGIEEPLTYKFDSTTHTVSVPKFELKGTLALLQFELDS